MHLAYKAASPHDKVIQLQVWKNLGHELEHTYTWHFCTSDSKIKRQIRQSGICNNKCRKVNIFTDC